MVEKSSLIYETQVSCLQHETNLHDINFEDHNEKDIKAFVTF